MIYWKLFSIFFKIGMFTIGGGYAMLPLIQQEMERHNWLTVDEFIDMIAIAEMTPGAISVNTATFVGFRTGGFLGSILATAALALPSLIIIVLLSRFWEKYSDHPLMKSVLAGVRPAVAGLIVAAALFIAEGALLGPEGGVVLFGGIDLRGILIALVVFLGVQRYKVDPIKAIIASGVAGLILFR